MAQRMGQVRVDSAEVQGPASFVVVRKLGYAQRQMATRMIAEAFGGRLPTNGEIDRPVSTEFLEENDAFTRSLLLENVLEWNWVDFDGQPLPLPKVDPDVIGRLTDEEVNWLARAINGGKTAAETKN